MQTPVQGFTGTLMGRITRVGEIAGKLAIAGAGSLVGAAIAPVGAGVALIAVATAVEVGITMGPEALARYRAGDTTWNIGKSFAVKVSGALAGRVVDGLLPGGGMFVTKLTNALATQGVEGAVAFTLGEETRIGVAPGPPSQEQLGFRERVELQSEEQKVDGLLKSAMTNTVMGTLGGLAYKVTGALITRRLGLDIEEFRTSNIVMSEVNKAAVSFGGQLASNSAPMQLALSRIDQWIDERKEQDGFIPDVLKQELFATTFGEILKKANKTALTVAATYAVEAAATTTVAVAQHQLSQLRQRMEKNVDDALLKNADNPNLSDVVDDTVDGAALDVEATIGPQPRPGHHELAPVMGPEPQQEWQEQSTWTERPFGQSSLKDRPPEFGPGPRPAEPLAPFMGPEYEPESWKEHTVQSTWADQPLLADELGPPPRPEGFWQSGEPLSAVADQFNRVRWEHQDEVRSRVAVENAPLSKIGAELASVFAPTSGLDAMNRALNELDAVEYRLGVPRGHKDLPRTTLLDVEVSLATLDEYEDSEYYVEPPDRSGGEHVIGGRRYRHVVSDAIIGQASNVILSLTGPLGAGYVVADQIWDVTRAAAVLVALSDEFQNDPDFIGREYVEHMINQKSLGATMQQQLGISEEGILSGETLSAMLWVKYDDAGNIVTHAEGEDFSYVGAGIAGLVAAREHDYRITQAIGGLWAMFKYGQ